MKIGGIKRRRRRRKRRKRKKKKKKEAGRLGATRIFILVVQSTCARERERAISAKNGKFQGLSRRLPLRLSRSFCLEKEGDSISAILIETLSPARWFMHG